MPRVARLDAAGVLHHVIFRGIERRKIFRSAADKDWFVQRLGHLLTASRTSSYAWALMDNHVHLLLRTGDASLSTLMRRLLTGYAGYFNRQHGRHGQLFQNRYKSIRGCRETGIPTASYENFVMEPWSLRRSDIAYSCFR